MKLLLTTFFTFLLLFGCKDEISNDKNSAFFGGEIVNPKNDYVVIKSSDHAIDTIQLDENNRFLKKIENITPSLYTFKHGDEYQIVLLEPQDSILFRLNTIDFDDSLVFTGDGSKKNNVLIKIFLENEVDSKKLMKNFEYEPEEFMEYLDSSRKVRLENLKEFLELKPQSDLFKSIAEASINYHYYSIKEIYPFGYFGNNNLIHYTDLPEEFYSYRDEIDYNKEEFSEVFAYNSFLFRHFNNLALEKFYHKNGHNVPFDRESISFNLGKLHMIDSLVSNNNIKNYLLKYTTQDYIFNSHNEEEIDEMLNSFISKSSNEEFKKDMIAIVLRAKSTKPNNEFPDIEVLNYNDNVVNLKSILYQPTVIYFWSSTYKVHNRNVHYQIKKLRTKYPKISFYGINIGNDSEAYWKQTISQLKSPPNSEFRFINSAEAIKALAVNSVNKVYVVDAKKKILSSHINMFNDEFEELLKSL